MPRPGTFGVSRQSPAEACSTVPVLTAYSDWVEDSDRLAGGFIRVR
jgi:hypothetical protein